MTKSKSSGQISQNSRSLESIVKRREELLNQFSQARIRQIEISDQISALQNQDRQLTSQLIALKGALAALDELITPVETDSKINLETLAEGAQDTV